MAEGETISEIKPYRFLPVSVSNYSDPDTSSSKSETDIREQASFTERLGVSMLQGNGGYCQACG